MAKWFLRDRGQVLGPYTTEEILAMRAQGTVASYHEVSTDRRAWKVIDEVPELSPDARRSRPAARPKPAAAPRAARADDDAGYDPPAPRSGGTPRPYLLVVGGVLGLVLLGGVVLAGLLVYRARTKDTANTVPAGVSEGPITFTSQTGTRDRDQVLDASVGLIVAGLAIRERDGVKSEINYFGTGSGFVVTPAGHVVTNRHVVEKLLDFRNSQKHREMERNLNWTVEPKVWVFFGHEAKYEADVASIYSSPDHDLAILKIARPSARFFALSKVHDPDTPRLDPVFSLGYPGTDRDAQDILNPKDKKGLVWGVPIQRGFRDADFNLAKDRGGIRQNPFLIRADMKYRDTYYLTHSAKIAGGNSGGPLIAGDGTVVGLNTLVITVKVGKLEFNPDGQYYAQTLPQLRKEIDRQAPGVVWRDPSDGGK